MLQKKLNSHNRAKIFGPRSLLARAVKRVGPMSFHVYVHLIIIIHCRLRSKGKVATRVLMVSGLSLQKVSAGCPFSAWSSTFSSFPWVGLKQLIHMLSLSLTVYLRHFSTNNIPSSVVEWQACTIVDYFIKHFFKVNR